MTENNEVMEVTETTTAAKGTETRDANEGTLANEATEIKTVEAETVETMDDFKNELEASFRKISEGDIISGTVIRVSEDEVMLDLKYYASGIIKASDLSNDPNFHVLSEIHEGDELKATVVRLDDGEGNIKLSMKEAAEVLAWEKLKQYKEEATILSVKVGGIVNAGVIAYVEGVRGFIPASQLSLEYVEDLNIWLNKELDVRVITVEEEGQKLVLSGKSVARERQQEETNKKISAVIPGIILEGKVETIMPYGAFVKLSNGLSGLVHISQLSQKRIKTPTEVVKEGDIVKVKVLNTDKGKISLSMKALEEEVPEELQEEVFELPKSSATTTSLGDLLSKFKF